MLPLLSLSSEHTHKHTHTYTCAGKADAKQNSGSSKLHRGSNASTDALLLSCQLMVTEHS